MKTTDRYTKIENILREQNHLDVKKLAELTEVSEATIRRDLAKMEEDNIINRIWGGAQIKNDYSRAEQYHPSDEFSLLRFSLNTDIKMKLAEKAASLIPDNATIFIDSGSTANRMYKFLKQKNITVVTNSLIDINILARKHIKTFLASGFVNFDYATVCSDETVNSVSSFNYDMAFLGTSGVEEKAGFSASTYYDCIMKKAVINKSAKVYILADSTKFEVRRPYTFAKLEDCTLITEKAPDFEVKTIIVK